MTMQLPPNENLVAPTQVWPVLTPDLKVQVIWLLAQLTFNVVTAQTEHSSQAETNDITTL